MIVQFTVNGQTVDLDAKQAITININNPIFDAESMERTFSYPLRLPLTDHNRTIFPNVSRLDVDVNNDDYVGALYIDYRQLEKGIVKITGYDRRYIKVVFQNDSRRLAEQLEEININEILPIIPIPQNISSYYVLHAPLNDILDIYINGTNFLQNITQGDLDTRLQNMADDINAAFPDLQAIANPTSDTLRINNPNNINISLRIARGFELIENVPVANARQLNMLAYVDDVVQNPVDSHAFPVMFNFNFYKRKNRKWLGIINYWRGGEQIINTEHPDPEWEHTIVPLVKVKYLFEQILALTTFDGFTGDFWNDSEVQSLLDYNIRALDEVFQYYNVELNQQLVYLNAFKDQIDLNEHVHEVTANTYLTWFAEFCAVYYRINNLNKIEIIPKQDQLTQTPLDWTDKIEPDYTAKNAFNTGVTLDYEHDPNETFKNPDAGFLEPYIEGAGETKINTVFSTAHDWSQTISLANEFDWRVPNIRQPGWSDDYGKEEHTPRLLLYRGLQPDSENVNYPFAQSGTTNYHGNTVGSLSLDWNGANGMVATYWSGYLATIGKDEVTFNVRLEAQDIIDIKKWTNSRVTINHPNGTFLGVIKSLQFKATPFRGLSTSKVTFVKITT